MRTGSESITLVGPSPRKNIAREPGLLPPLRTSLTEPTPPEKPAWSCWGRADTLKAVFVLLLGTYILLGDGPDRLGRPDPGPPASGAAAMPVEAPADMTEAPGPVRPAALEVDGARNQVETACAPTPEDDVSPGASPGSPIPRVAARSLEAVGSSRPEGPSLVALGAPRAADAPERPDALAECLPSWSPGLRSTPVADDAPH